jgi:transcriptional regulator GlxA family with amidase domain
MPQFGVVRTEGRQPLGVRSEPLAWKRPGRKRLGVPSFNRHFRAATSTSPLQRQKTPRLQAARRLLATNADAARAAYAVGYESALQFSREYSRLFGRPAKQDASQLRANISEISNIMI